MSATNIDDDLKEIFKEAKEGKTEPNKPAPARPIVKRRAHSAYWVERQLHQKAFTLVAPGLRKAKQNEGMILIAMVLLSGIPAGFAGVYFWNYTHPPLHLVGYCPAGQGASIAGGECYVVQTTVINSVTTTVHIPSGTLYFTNGTAYTGSNGH